VIIQISQRPSLFNECQWSEIRSWICAWVRKFRPTNIIARSPCRTHGEGALARLFTNRRCLFSSPMVLVGKILTYDQFAANLTAVSLAEIGKAMMIFGGVMSIC